MNAPRSTLRIVGSLWFAAVLLVLALIAMACATVFEATHGAEQARGLFYGSWWFRALLGLLAANVAAALALRFPFSKKLLGFAVLHLAILVVLAGALVTRVGAIDGRIAIPEGATVDALTFPGEDTLVVSGSGDQEPLSIDLSRSLRGGFEAVEQPNLPAQTFADARITIKGYLPDSAWENRVLEDTDARLPAAIQVSLSSGESEDSTWAFANRPAKVAGMGLMFRPLATPAELAQLLDAKSGGASGSVGTVKVDYAGQDYQIPVEECQEEPASLGQSGYSIRVLRYMPHAQVGPDRKIFNASSHPSNPAIEVEISGNSQSETRLCFAKVPGFSHRQQTIEGMAVTFVAAEEASPSTPIEILSGPDGELCARLSWQGMPPITREVRVGVPVETPWPDRKFAVTRRLEHARMEWALEPVEPVRESRMPALLTEVASKGQTQETWVQKYRAQRVTVGGERYELKYVDKEVPLGFAVTLNRFRIGTYPGTGRPRSFESHVTFLDPSAGAQVSRKISMNNPADFGGFTFYQSSWDDRGAKMTSVLSVSRDPGRPIVFAGYVALVLGMVMVLATRLADRRRMAQRRADEAAGENENAELIAGGFVAELPQDADRRETVGVAAEGESDTVAGSGG